MVLTLGLILLPFIRLRALPHTSAYTLDLARQLLGAADPKRLTGLARSQSPAPKPAVLRRRVAPAGAGSNEAPIPGASESPGRYVRSSSCCSPQPYHDATRTFRTHWRANNWICRDGWRAASAIYASGDRGTSVTECPDVGPTWETATILGTMRTKRCLGPACWGKSGTPLRRSRTPSPRPFTTTPRLPESGLTVRFKGDIGLTPPRPVSGLRGTEHDLS
jgi:hypothetical protein